MRRGPKKGSVKAAQNALIRACDNLWRRIVLLRAGCKCEICGAPRAEQRDEMIIIDACHIISRNYWSTRWDPRNGVTGCRDCHDHKIIMAWLERTDKRRYNWIMRQKQKQVSHRDIDLNEILTELQKVA